MNDHITHTHTHQMRMSQRSFEVLIIDNNSPFTSHLMDIVSDLGYSYDYKRYSEIKLGELGFESLPWFNKVILSGRKTGNSYINAANSTIVRYCYTRNIPILGICYGCQIIALTLGGSLRRLEKPMKDFDQVTVKMDNALVFGKQRLMVYKSHKFCVSKLPPCLDSAGESLTCPNEILLHREKPIFGTQFHPEISGADGRGILANFMAL
ncbi:MAG: gamma-glutamyl-gamma-aminobutyrate hydrolase family protein [Nitrososphaeraceae archaeon]